MKFVSSLSRGHATLLCKVQNLSDDRVLGYGFEFVGFRVQTLMECGSEPRAELPDSKKRT